MSVRTIPHFLLVFLTLIYKVSCEGVSLTFAIDETGSMYDDIAQVRTEVDSIMDIVLEEKSSLISNIVLVTFNDPGVLHRKTTNIRDELKTALSNVYVDGGDDCPEMALSGVKLALEKSLPGSYIYVFTDASAKDYYKSEEIKQLCQRRQTQIIFVLTGDCSYPNSRLFQVYYEIATACSGLAFRVEKNEVNQVLNTIRETIKGNKTVLTSRVTPANVYTNVLFSIDDLTEYAIVSSSGTDVSLEIGVPSGTHPDIERIMWTRNAKVIKIKNPHPGQYVATVRGSSATSVIATGRSDFLFQHGFSEEEPKSIDDTAPQPISETLTHLSLSVKDPKHSVRIKSAQILDMMENVIKTLPLKELSPNFYVTEPIIAPSDMFKIGVTGKAIQTGEPVRRIAKIPVTPQKASSDQPLAKVPVVKIQEGASVEVARGAALTLTCKVYAYPKPEITWRNEKGIIMKSTSSLVQIHYDYISYLRIPKVSKDARYHCHARNVLNEDYKSINVVTRHPITVKSALKDTTKIAYGKSSTLNCDVTSPLPLEINWYHVDKSTGKTVRVTSSKKYSISSDRKQLTITSMDVDLVGKYTCKAHVRDNPNEKQEMSTNVEIYGLEAPKITGVAIQKVTIGAAVSIKCKVIKGIPSPRLSWQYKPTKNGKFADIANIGNEWHTANVTTEHSGYYKCIATNSQGTNEHVVQLIVQVPARIITGKLVYEGITSDIALRVPCDTTGYPKPVIRWAVNGSSVLPENKYAIEEGALIIKNPTKSDGNASYTCTATNTLRSDSKQFQVIVTDTLNDYGVRRHVHMLKDQSIELKCTLPRTGSSTVQWFINGVDMPIYQPIMSIMNAEVGSEGNYTCHVTDVHGSTTETFVLHVGYAPEFKYPLNPVIEWNGEKDEFLRCDVDAIPEPDIEWLFNGKPLVGQSSYELEIIGWGAGHYKCNVSNLHGAVQRDFEVKKA